MVALTLFSFLLLPPTSRRYAQLQSATTYKNDDGEEEIGLSMTPVEFDDLIGYVAAESNHARTKRQREDLDAICDYFEAYVSDIKRSR
jgi:hypothetical protein